MAIIFQLCVIFLVGLIAYWWANQGFFSSVLHFACVVCAGAIAFAFWEPLVAGVLLQNGFFDNYVWGASLVVLFVVSLAILRTAMDRLVPANVNIPHGADLALGGVFGVGSGILTVGILLIGVGFIQTTNEILGLRFLTREYRGISDVHDGETHALWVPAHEWTTDFFEFVSAGSFYPEFTRQPLAKVNPNLDQVAFSLHRDSFDEGRGRTSIAEDAVRIVRAAQHPGAFTVDVRVTNEAYDHAQQFTLSASQVRLLTYEHGDIRRGRVAASHPARWTQPIADGTTRQYEFDDISHVVTSVPGQSEVTFQLEFPVGAGLFQVPTGYQPRYIQIKGLRFELPQIVVDGGRGSFTVERTQLAPENPNAPMADRGVIEVRHDIRPIGATINNIIGLEHTDRWLLKGQGTFKRGQQEGNRDTRVHGVLATEGTQIVTVHVNRDSAANLFDDALRAKTGDSAAPMLVDSNGGVYFAKGYLLETPDEYFIKLTPENLIKRVGDLPHLPTSNANRLRLIFEVTENVTLVSFRLGDETVCRANVLVRPQ